MPPFETNAKLHYLQSRPTQQLCFTSETSQKQLLFTKQGKSGNQSFNLGNGHIFYKNWMGGWMGVKAVLRIAYKNSKNLLTAINGPHEK